MFSLLLLLAGLVLSLVIGRAFTTALIVTGMTREAARFQARSALTGAGFTTTESEAIVNHPVRRRIVMQAMLVGNLGIVTLVGGFITTLARAGGFRDQGLRLLMIGVGLLLVLLASRSQWVERRLQGVTSYLARRVTDVDVRDYYGMLRLAGEYAVGELPVEADEWLAGKTLAEASLPNEGILVLGLTRANDEYVGAPTGGTRLEAGDLLILYGRQPVFAELDKRRAGVEGDRAHQAAIAEQARLVADEQERLAAETAETGPESGGSAGDPEQDGAQGRRGDNGPQEDPEGEWPDPHGAQRRA